MIDSVVVFAGLLIVRLIFAGISLAGGGAITGTDILFHYSLKDIVLYALKVLYFIAFTYLTAMLYYEDYEYLSFDQKRLMQEGMEAFGGIAPTYKIRLLDKPTIVWDFHSLMLGIQMMFSLMVTDQEKPMRICKHCSEVFVASRPSAVFCSPQCKNKYNVYKSRAKDKKE